MLPHLLSDTYKQYKEDTEQFLKWLAETAVDCGHVPTSFQPLTKGPRLKGKDRKKAKVAEANGAPATQHTVAIKEMIPLARSIAGSKNAVEVPTNILSLCRRAIAARERCITWYRGKAVEQINVEKSTRDHSYFVGVLKDVLNILESYIALHQPGSKQGKGCLGLAIKHAKKQTSEDQRTDWTNKNAFESLAVDEVGSEEVSLEDEDIAKTENPLNTTPGQYPSRSRVNFQPESSAGDVEFAIFCVLEDLGCIRRFLTKTWSDYHTGSISLINASLTTNTAIEFVRRIDEDFRAWFPECTDYQSTMKLVLPMVCALHGLDPSNIDCVHWEVEDFIYYDPFFNLREFRDAFEDAGDGKRLILEPLHDLFYDPRFDREGISEQERRANDRILLREIFPEFLILIVNGTLPTEDTITQGFRNMILEKRIYLWVVFGMQIFLDIHHTLGEHISRGLQEFRATTAQVKVTVDESCRYARSLGGKWCENNADYLKELQWNGDFIKTWVTDDALMNMRLKSTAGFDFSRHGVGKPYLLLRQHPLMCGLQMLALELKIQQGSVAYANNHGYVMAAAHLYNAVQKQGYLQLSWPEMDRLINLYTPEAIFVGPVPMTPQDFYKRYLLAEGASIEYFARNRRVDKTKRILRSKKGPLRFGENSAFIRVVRNHLCKYEGQVGTTLEEVENLLSNRNHGLNSNSSPLQTQKHTFQKLNPLQSLARLQEYVDEEEPTIHYDHLAMYRNALAMLRRIESTVPGLHETFSAWWSASRPSLKNLSLDATLYALPEYLLTKLSGNEGIAMARSGQSMLADTAGIIELCILQDQDTKRSETSTSEPPEATDASEYSPPTQWGKSDSGHPTRNGECLHVGVCQRQISEWAKTMTRLAQ